MCRSRVPSYAYRQAHDYYYYYYHHYYYYYDYDYDYDYYYYYYYSTLGFTASLLLYVTVGTNWFTLYTHPTPLT
mgnify:CR=1 FL=1